MDIRIYTKTGCPYCEGALELLDSLGVKYTNTILDDKKERDKIKAHFGHPTVPIIIIKGKIIGGFDNLLAIRKTGQLSKLINE